MNYREAGMQVLQTTPNNFEIKVTRGELAVICNCINEACNGLSIPEFATRVGAPREDVEAMLCRLSAALDGR